MRTPDSSLLLRISGSPLPRALLLLLVIVAACAPLSLYLARMASYSMDWDDFRFVHDGLNWDRTRSALWKPFSTHFCPPFRLLTWALVASAGRLSAVPDVLCLSSMIGLVVLLLVLYEFVCRETDSAMSGVTAVLVGGMTTVYFPAVATYALSQALWALTFTLVVLLCLQSSRMEFRWPAAIGAMLGAMLAPAWFAGGLVAGPVGSLYAWLSGAFGRPLRQRLLLAAAPLVGSCLFAGIVLLVAGHELFQPANFGQHPPLEAFRPGVGAYLTSRLLSEHVWLWSFGIQTQFATEQFWVFFLALIAFGAYWLRRAPWRPLALCGLTLMLASSMLVYSFRSYMDLDTVRVARWYLVFPHIGWTMFLTAGVDGRLVHGRPMKLPDAARLAVLGLALFLLHRPVAVEKADAMRRPQQRHQLGQVELIDAVSRRWQLDRASVRQALGSFQVSGSGGFDGLDLIEFPETGRPWNPDALRRGLQAVLATGSAEAFELGPDPTRQN